MILLYGNAIKYKNMKHIYITDVWEQNARRHTHKIMPQRTIYTKYYDNKIYFG